MNCILKFYIENPVYEKSFTEKMIYDELYESFIIFLKNIIAMITL